MKFCIRVFCVLKEMGIVNKPAGTIKWETAISILKMYSEVIDILKKLLKKGF